MCFQIEWHKVPKLEHQRTHTQKEVLPQKKVKKRLLEAIRLGSKVRGGLLK